MTNKVSPDFFVEVARYPKRTKRKIETMYSIYCLLPARFNGIQRTLKRSPTTVSNRLQDMEKLGIIKIERKTEQQSMRTWHYNVYDENPSFEQFMGRSNWATDITPEKKFEIKVVMKMKLKFKIKKRGGKPMPKGSRKSEHSLLEGLPEEMRKALEG